MTNRASSPSTFYPSHSNDMTDPSPIVFTRQLSQKLEAEIREDDREFAEYGGDYPLEPPQLHLSHHHRWRPDSSSLHSEDDLTAVNSVAEHKLESPLHSSAVASEASLHNEIELVDWDSEDDPENPQNFPFRKKMLLTAITILLTINVTFASSAPSTATLAIASEFKVSIEVSILITSLFLTGYIFGPLLWSGASEIYGRRIVFNTTIIIYTLFILGQTLGKNIQTILITRFLSGLFASAPLTNGAGLLADIWDPVGRGPAVAVFSAAVFIGPICGPIIGSFIVASDLGWRWVFWVLMIFSGFCWLVSCLFLPETFAPVLLVRKAKRLRKADPANNAKRYAAIEKQDWSIKGIAKRTILRPFIMLAGEPILVLITIYLSLVYGLIYALFEVFPIIFEEIRGIKPTLSGLTFLGVGIGTSIGAYIFYKDGLKYVHLTKKWRGHPPAEERLTTGMIGGPLLSVAIFWLTWTGAYKSVPWYVPEIAAIPLGTAIALVFMSFQSYLVDTYLMYSASALAGNSLIRSAAGAAFPLFVVQMFHNLGVQWAGTLLGCIALLLAPLPFVFYKFGPWIRTKSKFAPCIDLKIKDEIESEEKRMNEKGSAQHMA